MTVTIHPRFCSTSRGSLRFYGMSFAHLSCHKSCFIAGLSILIYHPDFPKTCFGAGFGGGHFTNLLSSVEKTKSNLSIGYLLFFAGT